MNFQQSKPYMDRHVILYVGQSLYSYAMIDLLCGKGEIDTVEQNIELDALWNHWVV